MAVEPVHPALVLGLRDTGLGVVRALGRAGIPTVGLDWRRHIGFASRYVSASRCPHPVREADRFVEAVLALARTHAAAPPVLFITNDQFLHAVSDARAQLAPHLVMLEPAPELARRLLNKHRLQAWCVEHGIPAPRSVYAPPGTGLADDVDALAGPLFLKPDSPVHRPELSGAKGLVLSSPAEARRAAASMAGHGLIVQEVVEGPDSAAFKYCACLGRDGRPVVEFSLQKVRNFPPRFGVGCCCVSRADAEVFERGRRVCAALGYQGVISIEFKRDARDSVLKLIEINGRYWQQIALGVACGLNVPATHYALALGRTPSVAATWREGVTWIDLDKDARTYAVYRREGTCTPEAWRESRRAPRVYPEIDWRDPWPVVSRPSRWPAVARWARLEAGGWRR